MNQKLVSVIVPAYNAEKNISKCVNSIINQTYLNIQVIIIDDGSKDNTKKIVEAIPDERIICKTICNGGVSNARNVGLNLATGDYVMFVDSDDYIEQNAIEKLVNVIEEYDVDIIRFNGYIETKDKSIKKIEFPIKDNVVYDTRNSKEKEQVFKLYNDSEYSLRGYCWLLFMKNCDIKPFNCDLVYLEDKLFCLDNMLNSKKILFYNNCLYYYVFNENSVTKDCNKFISNIDNILKSKRYFLELSEENNFNCKDLIELNYIILLLYRLDFYIGLHNYRQTKDVLHKCLLKIDLNGKLYKKYKINKIKKIQLILLDLKCNFLYYLITKLKQKI